MGTTQLHSFKSPFFHLNILSICPSVLIFSPLVFPSPPPPFPMFLISLLFPLAFFLFVQTRYNNSLFAREARWRRWKKSNKHKPRLPLDSAVVSEMLFKRDTWSIFPFHLDALTASFSPSPIWTWDVRAFLAYLLIPQAGREKGKYAKGVWIMQGEH